MYKFLRRIYYIFFEIQTNLYKLYLIVVKVKYGKNLKLIGLPSIIKAPNSEIELGQNISILSKETSNPVGLNHKSIIRTISSNAIIKIGENVGMSGVSIVARKKIIIKDNVLLGANVIITDSDHHPINYKERIVLDPTNIISKEVLIEKNVWIGANAIILKGVTIGENSIIGANSVVTTNIPSNVIVAGNPARIIRKLSFDK